MTATTGTMPAGTGVNKTNTAMLTMNDKSWNTTAFCQQVSRLMVNEIRKRASNQSTEAASIAIVKFLEMENSRDENSTGWLLLTTLNLLANGDNNLIQVSSSSSSLCTHCTNFIHN